MDPETRRLLEETHALAKDNHRMLNAIRRGQVLGFLSTVIIWIVVLALPLYLYQQYVEPTIAKFSASSGLSPSTTSGFLGLPSFSDIKNLINSSTAGE